jgi:phosphoribosylglycinamide formyltransferase 1
MGKKIKNIAVFASGKGSNAENIINHFNKSGIAKVSVVITNNPSAGVIEKAMMQNVECYINLLAREQDSDQLLQTLQDYEIDLIVLAGFLKLIPKTIIKKYPKSIVNIHPALLPKYGGKGMYGMRVHEKVIANKEKQSGISIHYVNEQYDEGPIIAQYNYEIDENETPSSLAKNIQLLEHKHFPKVLEDLIGNMKE